MTNMYVVDGNNWFRRRAETVIKGSPIRNCFFEIQNRPEAVVIVWDGRGGLSKRREIFPDYKKKRNSPGESFFESQDLLKKLLRFSKAVQVQVDGYEGDDVIAEIVSRYDEKCERIFLESNDLDLYQLGVPMAREKYPEIPRWVKLYKTMVGDPSDNIPGAKGFGKGAWNDLDDKKKQVLEHIISSGQGLTNEEVEDMVKEFYPNRGIKWFLEKQNRETLLLFYKIVGFLPVPWELVEKNMVAGYNTPHLAQPIFEEFML